MIGIEKFSNYVSTFYSIYLILYITFLWIGVVSGGYRLYQSSRMKKIHNELKHKFYFPVSILVPAYNEEVTIVDTVISLMDLEYQLYEIIVVDDGSKDCTAQVLIDHFKMDKVSRPIRKKIPCQAEEAIYEFNKGKVKLTLIRKKNGGKGDALNMGINAAENPYFLCMDADSMLQRDSLENIVRPLLEDDTIVAVGGLVQIAQCVQIVRGKIVKQHLSWKPMIGFQVMEYMRSFFASRILLDRFNGNLIISGSFGLFKKDIVTAVGGYATDTLGEDMELVVKLHSFCTNNNIPYKIKYEPNAVCWSQAPTRIKDLMTQRRRWHLGLLQCMARYREVFANSRYGMISAISYMYYLFYELLSPIIEVGGILITLLGCSFGVLNIKAMVQLFILYTIYNILLTLTAFFQCIYTQSLKLTLVDILKAFIMCILENVFFHYLISWTRVMAFISYKKTKETWGSIQRTALNKVAQES